MPTIKGFHHLSLTVRDAARSEEFYARAFGFVKVLELADEAGRGYKRIIAHGESRTIIGFSVHQANDGSPFSEFQAGLDHFAFGVSSRAELDDWAAHLDVAGIEHSEIRDTGIGLLMTVRDPDNIQVELWADPS